MKSFKEFRELMSSVKFSPEILSMADQTATETAMRSWGDNGWEKITKDSIEEGEMNNDNELNFQYISEYGANIYSYPKSGIKALDGKNFNQESYLPPDENPDYVKIGPYSVGEVKKKYDNVLKKAYEINDKYAGIIRGHYVPILIKIKKD